MSGAAGQDPAASVAIIEHGLDEAGQFETRGADFIPDSERHGKASDLLWVWLGAQFSFGIIVVGSLPVLFGLGWWSSLSALVVGVGVGSLLFMPLALFGPRTGTNDPVASGAHFGVRGRAIGTAISIFVGLGFYALTVWTGGQAVMVGGEKLFGTGTSNTALGIAMAIVAVGTILAALYGHATLVVTFKVTTFAIGILLLALVLVLIPDFDAGYKGGEYLLGTFWPTWFLSASIGAALPISYATFGGDYSRYFPRATSDRGIVFWNGLGMFVSNVIALGIGAYVTTMFTDFDAAFVQGVTDAVPSWFVFVVLLIGVVGTWPQGALCLYDCGLSATTLGRLFSRRIPTTIFLSLIGLGVVFLSVLAFAAIDSITAFVLIMNVTISPWMAIMLVGFVLRRGLYYPLDLQWYATPERRGCYWFTHGFNLRALVAFVPAAVIGFLFSATTLYTGPFANSAKGVDLSYGSAFLIAGFVYYALVKAFPERGLTVEVEDEAFTDAVVGA